MVSPPTRNVQWALLLLQCMDRSILLGALSDPRLSLPTTGVTNVSTLALLNGAFIKQVPFPLHVPMASVERLVQNLLLLHAVRCLVFL